MIPNATARGAVLINGKAVSPGQPKMPYLRLSVFIGGR